ncbi:Peroxiredoxin [Solimonas aquatica]|uniref:thioredoxin-dependent peroxiredoxin n=1 Tax=Solimonas aquatica TaxID=489703 RepID=A0A1H8ZUF2_9GAMM|nr:peroxiredoxin [Solimonas aquatica]SEP68092.1 Peroxiredoxin [Solimonas aquatica]
MNAWRYCLTLCALLLAAPAFAALPVGASAPMFEARASMAGEAFDYSLAQALKKGPVVVYFYPSAYTGGCNVQAHSFAVNLDKFAAAGASVIGVSLDSIERLNDFSADPEYCAGKLAVASDADGRIARRYELSIREAQAGRKDTRGIEIGHGFAERTTFIVDRQGRIASVIGGMGAAENVAASLAAVQKLSADP